MKNVRNNKWCFKTIILIVVVLLGVIWWTRVTIKENIISDLINDPLPTPQPYQPAPVNIIEDEGVDVVKKDVEKLPDNISLAVPFAPQAPHANWDQPYQDACEEAAVIMVEQYLRGAGLTPDEMDQEILKMVAWEDEFLGFSKDTNIAEVKRLVENYSSDFQASARYDITMDDVKEQLIKGNPVIVLANGQLLGNPYYTQPGPEKHALVIKGFTDNKFITNDPGTKRGADFVYSSNKIFNAIVDYDGGTPGTGKKAMIVILPR
jgi:hypothetical protein